jgi:hypothetical protein
MVCLIRGHVVYAENEERGFSGSFDDASRASVSEETIRKLIRNSEIASLMKQCAEIDRVKKIATRLGDDRSTLLGLRL